VGTPADQPSCYVFDSSSLIQLERSNGLRRLPGVPGKWLVIPSRVAKEVGRTAAPPATKNWLESGKLAAFSDVTSK